MTQQSANSEELSDQTAPVDSEVAVQEIEILLDELATWIGQGRERADFYAGLLDRGVTAIDCVAGAVWVPTPDDQLSLTYQSQINDVYGGQRQLFEQDQKVLHSISDARTATLVSNQKRAAGSLLVHPIIVFEECKGYLVFYFDQTIPETVCRAFIPLLEALTELVVDYEKDRQLRSVNDRLTELGQLLSISMAVHGKSRKREVAYELANDGRAFLGIDRVTVFRRGSWKDKVLASSGLVRVDQRSSILRTMRRLVTQTCNYGSSVLFFGDQSSVPEGLARIFERYSTDTQSEFLAVVPIHYRTEQKRDPEQPPSRKDIIGAMVFEHGQSIDPISTTQKLDQLTKQASSAFTQAEKFERIPLRWIWGSLAGVFRQFAIDRIARAAVVLLMVAALTLAAIFYKADFNIEVRGELRPIDERFVFALIDGEIDQVHVEHGQLVEQDQLLLSLTSAELDKELNEIRGNFESINSRIGSLEIAIRQANAGDQNPQLTQAQLAAEIEELEEQRKTLANRQAFLLEEKKKLEIRSPIAGQVVTWNVQQRLISRPIKKGDTVMKIADTNGQWHVQFEIPDRKIGYVLNRETESDTGDDGAADVSFVVATEPDKKISGSLQEISNVTYVNDQQVAVVRTYSSFDNSELTERRVGAEVVGKINCGKRNVIYVWTYELVDAMKRRFFF